MTENVSEVRPDAQETSQHDLSHRAIENLRRILLVLPQFGHYSGTDKCVYRSLVDSDHLHELDFRTSRDGFILF